MMVPVFKVNCLMLWLEEHCQRRVLAKKLTLVLPHVGQVIPFGQRRATR
jgi:hypothetical protein